MGAIKGMKQGFRPPTLPAHLDEEPTDTLQWKRGCPFHLR